MISRSTPARTTAPAADLDSVLQAFAKLKVGRAGGRVSLKKPVLLLVVVSRMERGVLGENKIRFGEIEADYKRALQAATGKSVGNLAEPFVRMGSSDFWSLRGPEGVTIGAVKRVLNREDVWAEFDGGTFGLLTESAEARQRVIGDLIQKWVPADRHEVVSAVLDPAG